MPIFRFNRFPKKGKGKQARWQACSHRTAPFLAPEVYSQPGSHAYLRSVELSLCLAVQRSHARVTALVTNSLHPCPGLHVTQLFFALKHWRFHRPSTRPNFRKSQLQHSWNFVKLKSSSVGRGAGGGDVCIWQCLGLMIALAGQENRNLKQIKESCKH